jgi:hypothetical protein
MNRVRKWAIFLLVLLLTTNGGFYIALADGDEYKERKRYQKRHRNDSKHYGKRYLTPVNNPTYKEECCGYHLHMPVIICTGYSERISENKAEAIGVSKYIEKPMDTRNLAAALREVLEEN